MIETTLKIEGMMCGMCESHINETIRKDFPIAKVKSSHRKKQIVILSEQELDPERLQEVIDQTGYYLEGISSKTYVPSGLFSRCKS
ncbi:MAG: heavy-metal-associated domain-containing protein [Allobaculum sp.]